MNIVVGPCKCGGYGQCYDEDSEKELGRCHDELNAALSQSSMGEGEMVRFMESPKASMGLAVISLVLGIMALFHDATLAVANLSASCGWACAYMAETGR